jgi:uncharacterized protein (DUF697 family)
MGAEDDEGAMIQLVRAVLAQGVDGFGGVASSAVLADQYLSDPSYPSLDARVDALIRWEASRNFGTGFVTGLGGLITLPVAVPASMYANWFLQARLAGAIASLYGYNTSEERVRTLVLLSLIGDAGREVVKGVGVQVGNKLGMKAVQAVPGKVLIEINKQVGFKLITKAGKTGVINLVKVVPVAGGLVGGAVDGASCVAVGRMAKSLFARELPALGVDAAP